MSRVYGVHKVELKPGVNTNEFERFVVEELYPSTDQMPGIRWRLLKGDRGDREGKYLMMFKFDSVERRDRYASGRGEDPLDEYYQERKRMAPVLVRWAAFVVSSSDPNYTDYVVIGE